MTNYAIESLTSDHKKIRCLLKVIKGIIIDYTRSIDAGIGDLKNISFLIDAFESELHHRKEDEILFEYMKKHLGKKAVEMIDNDLTIEHNITRHYNQMFRESVGKYEKDRSITEKFNIIIYLSSYYELISRHMDKENNILFPYAIENFSDDVKKELDEEIEAYDDRRAKDSIILESLLNELYRKYGEASYK